VGGGHHQQVKPERAKTAMGMQDKVEKIRLEDWEFRISAPIIPGP
jgi:hypothetical protein